MSIEVKGKVEGHSEYRALSEDNNTMGLFKLIREVCSTKTTSQYSSYSRVEAELRMWTMRQHKRESIAAYHLRFQNTVQGAMQFKACIGDNVDVIEEDLEAINLNRGTATDEE